MTTTFPIHLAAPMRRSLRRQRLHQTQLSFGHGAVGDPKTKYTILPGPPAGSTVAAEVGMKLAEQLKRLAPANRQGFLKLFGVERMRDLKAADEAPARAYIAKRAPATGLYQRCCISD